MFVFLMQQKIQKRRKIAAGPPAGNSFYFTCASYLLKRLLIHNGRRVYDWGFWRMGGRLVTTKVAFLVGTAKQVFELHPQAGGQRW